MLADNINLEKINTEELKSIGPFWGGWPTWRTCGTDNVICYDLQAAQGFINRNYQTRCNFFIPNSLYQILDRPENVRLFAGEFNLETDYKNEIICMHLLASISDVVLLMGLDLSTSPSSDDKLKNHRWHNYKNLVKQVVIDNPAVQWVLIDHNLDVDKEFKHCENLTFDSLSNVVKLLLR